ncbi:hypothetical protein FB107DRAFT_277646 [Schizophyllum commune]
MQTGPACVPDVWPLLLAETQRWRTVRLELTSVKRTPVPFTLVLDVPELEQAGLYLPVARCFRNVINLKKTPLHWFADAPKLHCLFLAWPFYPLSVRVVWGRITHLILELHDSLQECVAVLPHCTALEYLEVSAWEVKWGERLPVAEVPTLQTLVLDKDAVVLCCYISTPQLTRLSFCPNPVLSVERCHALVMLGRRQSLQNLRYLYMRHSLFEWSHIDPVLEHLSGITHLQFVHLPPHRFRGVPPRMCDIGRLHTLRRISLHVSEEEWCDNETPRLPEWLAWEIGRLPNLETLDLWDRPDPGADPELDEWIEARSERGVEVERRTDLSPSFDKRDDWYSGNIRRP